MWRDLISTGCRGKWAARRSSWRAPANLKSSLITVEQSDSQQLHRLLSNDMKTAMENLCYVENPTSRTKLKKKKTYAELSSKLHANINMHSNNLTFHGFVMETSSSSSLVCLSENDLRLPCGIIVKVSLYWFKWFVRKTALLGKCIFYGVMECFFVTVSNWWYEWLLSERLPATAWLGFGLQEALFCCFLLVFCISWSSGVFLFFGECLIMTCVFCQPLVFVQKNINCHLEGLGKSVKLFTSDKKLLATCWSDFGHSELFFFCSLALPLSVSFYWHGW